MVMMSISNYAARFKQLTLFKTLASKSRNTGLQSVLFKGLCLAFVLEGGVALIA